MEKSLTAYLIKTSMKGDQEVHNIHIERANIYCHGMGVFPHLNAMYGSIWNKFKGYKK